MKKNKIILYVEDNDYIREEAVEYLSLLYTTVLEASNGEEALDIYKKHKPHIIITDIEMPILSGLEMVKTIRKEDKKTPIIMVTAFKDIEYLQEAIELRLVKYIFKPMTQHKLKMALNLAEEWIGCEEDVWINLSDNSAYNKLSKVLMVNNNEVHLSHNETALLNLLLQKPNTLISYGEIKNKIWNYEDNYRDALRTLVRALRVKLQNDILKNVSGVGYRLDIVRNF